MKRTFTVILALLAVLSANAQRKEKMPSKFDVVVSFGSMASGPSSDGFLRDFIKSFNKKNKLNIPAYKASGCGREGEFNILFSTSKLKGGVKKKFASAIRSVVAKEELKNKAKNPSSGNITVDSEKELSDYNYCRGGVSRW